MICLAIPEPVIRINQKDVGLQDDVYVAWHGTSGMALGVSLSLIE